MLLRRELIPPPKTKLLRLLRLIDLKERFFSIPRRGVGSVFVLAWPTWWWRLLDGRIGAGVLGTSGCGGFDNGNDDDKSLPFVRAGVMLTRGGPGGRFAASRW